MNTVGLAELRDTLLALYECARKLGVHEVAYHALSAALHAAEELRDFDTYDLVESQARSHLKLLDSLHPPHPMSTASAAERGHHSPYEQLAVLASAARVRTHAEKVLHKSKGRPQAPSETQPSSRA